MRVEAHFEKAKFNERVAMREQTNRDYNTSDFDGHRNKSDVGRFFSLHCNLTRLLFLSCTLGRKLVFRLAFFLSFTFPLFF